MENKIQLRFTLDNLDKIGFKADFEDQDFLKWLQSLQQEGVKFNSSLYDDLCKNTINNGHTLLTSKNIFLIDGGVVGPIAKIIGQYLFRLLLGANDFLDYLHLARKQKKELEIILEFDPNNESSRKIMNLPWELMYCPERHVDGEEEENEEGFFVSQAASIYRKYKEVEEVKFEENREVYVSIAFLTKDIDNLKDIYDELKGMAEKISQSNPNLYIEFINTLSPDQKTINLLSLEDLDKIFLSGKTNEAGGPVTKIVHLICDISISDEKKDEAGNPIYEKALYFNKTKNITEPKGLTSVFKELFNKNILQDSSLKLLVLQACNEEEKNNAYSGFEDIANRVIKKNQTAIISMPYVLNQKSVDGKSAFFNTLYQGLANSLSIQGVVQKLRNDIVPKFSYGFPLLYLNNRDTILVSKESVSLNKRPGFSMGTIETDPEYIQRTKLEEQRNLLIEQKGDFALENTLAVDPAIKFKLKKDIEKIEENLKKIDEELKKYSIITVRVEPTLPNK